jgi:YegS/Rv2252/BmrU family lipid kinase
MKNKWMLIINPKAGNGKGEREWENISKMMSFEEIPFDHKFSTHPFHAIEIVKQKIAEGYRKFVAVGGDGTLHDVVNGIMQEENEIIKESCVAVIPVGNGNDWCRTYNVPFDYASAIQVIKKEKHILQDLAQISFIENGEQKNRYIINMAGIGFDAVVCQKVTQQKEKGKSGQTRYLINLFSSLMSYKSMSASVEIDGKKTDGELFTMNVGVCQYNGGGMKQLPKALPADGFLDVMITRKISKSKIIRKIKMLFDGSFIELPEVMSCKAKNVKVNSQTHLLIEIDGEIMGGNPYEFNLIPKAINVVIK